MFPEHRFFVGIGVIHRNRKTIEPFYLETCGIHIMNEIFQPETFLEISEQLHCVIMKIFKSYSRETPI